MIHKNSEQVPLSRFMNIFFLYFFSIRKQLVKRALEFKRPNPEHSQTLFFRVKSQAGDTFDERCTRLRAGIEIL